MEFAAAISPSPTDATHSVPLMRACVRLGSSGSIVTRKPYEPAQKSIFVFSFNIKGIESFDASTNPHTTIVANARRGRSTRAKRLRLFPQGRRCKASHTACAAHLSGRIASAKPYCQNMATAAFHAGAKPLRKHWPIAALSQGSDLILALQSVKLQFIKRAKDLAGAVDTDCGPQYYGVQRT